MAEVRAVLRRCDPSVLDLVRDPEPLDSGEAAGTLLFLMDSRRAQKVLWRQLFVLDSMMSLLEGLESTQQLLTQPCPSLPEGGARGRWKALKVESRASVEETETLLIRLQDRIAQTHQRRHTLQQLLQQLHNKKEHCDHLEESLQKAQNALQACDGQLTKLRAESETLLAHLLSWQHHRDQLQAHMAAVQDVTQNNLLSVSQSELCVELKPRPPTGGDTSSNELEPLRLSVTWSHNDRFRLQVNEGAADLVQDCLSGRSAELSAALLEALQSFAGQADLLMEIQTLRSSFAIDWHPAQRVLVYLKSASLVCHLAVEEGYPSSGRARLLSVHRDGQPVDTCSLQPPHSNLRLTDWLVFLCTRLI
ncbi:uncharacterized protein ACBR49_012943 [Aulostomus maculatus]